MSLEEKLPDLFIEHGALFVPDVGPEAAFRVLTIKELKGLAFFEDMEADNVVDTIIKRTIVYPTYDEYLDAPAWVHKVVAQEILKTSKLGGIEDIKSKLNAATYVLSSWDEGCMIAVANFYKMSVEDIKNLTYDKFLMLLAGASIANGIDYSPVVRKQNNVKSAIEKYERLSNGNK